MDIRTCTACGLSFSFAGGVGRPPSRCPECRTLKKYGNEHQKLRAETVEAAYGQLCSRCGFVMWHGQQIHLDHNDNGLGYRGYSHASCNMSAGGKKGNAIRAGNPTDDVRKPHHGMEWHAAKREEEQRIAAQRMLERDVTPPISEESQPLPAIPEGVVVIRFCDRCHLIFDDPTGGNPTRCLGCRRDEARQRDFQAHFIDSD